LYEQLNSPYDENLPGFSLKDMDELYKSEFVSSNQSGIKAIGNWIWDQMRGFGQTAYSSDLRG